MTKQELDDILKRKGYSIEDNNIKAPRKIAKLECSQTNALEKAARSNEPDTSKYVVRVTSVRTKLLDEDNICEKLTVDGLRYAGIIPSDAPDKTHIVTTQRKKLKGEEEHTLIEIEQIE